MISKSIVSQFSREIRDILKELAANSTG